MILIKDLRLSIRSEDNEALAAIISALGHGTTAEDITKLKLHKSSIDARRKNNIVKVCSYYFECAKKIPLPVNAEHVTEEKYEYKKITAKPDKSILVAGAGPAGLFAAHTLLKAGFPVTIVERGYDVDKRRLAVEKLMKDGILDPVSNIQFGEGGAGTFSDGKLTTGIKNTLCSHVKRLFYEFGAPESILYEAHAHVGTDKLVNVVKNMRTGIIKLGGQFMFETMLKDIAVENNKITGAELQTTGMPPFWAEVSGIILATGHSARDTYHMLAGQKILLRPKPFSIGARIEHSGKMINLSQYGTDIGRAAEYKLACHLRLRDVYTFCMCPGGTVVPAASEAGGIVTNGMSEYKRDGRNANSALLVNVTPDDFNNDALQGIEFQRKYERAAYALTGSMKAPVQTVGDFLSCQASVNMGDVKPTYLPGVVPGDLNKCLPEFAVQSMREAIRIFDNKLKGFAHSGAMLTGVETRSSSPVRIVRDENHMSNIEGLYPCGEGSGYAGGIMSAAVDGITAAESIIRRMNG